MDKKKAKDVRMEGMKEDKKKAEEFNGAGYRGDQNKNTCQYPRGILAYSRKLNPDNDTDRQVFQRIGYKRLLTKHNEAQVK